MKEREFASDLARVLAVLSSPRKPILKPADLDRMMSETTKAERQTAERKATAKTAKR